MSFGGVQRRHLAVVYDVGHGYGSGPFCQHVVHKGLDGPILHEDSVIVHTDEYGVSMALNELIPHIRIVAAAVVMILRLYDAHLGALACPGRGDCAVCLVACEDNDPELVENATTRTNVTAKVRPEDAHILGSSVPYKANDRTRLPSDPRTSLVHERTTVRMLSAD